MPALFGAFRHLKVFRRSRSLENELLWLRPLVGRQLLRAPQHRFVPKDLFCSRSRKDDVGESSGNTKAFRDQW